MMVAEMKKGDVVLVEIPSELAYGNRKSWINSPQIRLYTFKNRSIRFLI